MTNLTSNATLDATAICSEIAEMPMPVSTRTAPEGSLSAIFADVLDSDEATLEASVKPEPAKATKKPVPEKPAPAKAKAEAKPAKATPAKAKSEPAKSEPKITKKPKTILDGGLTYSLLSRVRNAYPADLRVELEEGSEILELVDGRGSDREISAVYVDIARDLGGAKYLSSVRTSHVKRLLKTKGSI
jgi:hypothetical protein